MNDIEKTVFVKIIYNAKVRLMGHKKEDMSLNAYATTNKEELLKTAKNRKFKS